MLAFNLSCSLELKLQSRQHTKIIGVNVETTINSALSNKFSTRRTYVISPLPCVPIVKNPKEAVSILSLKPRSCIVYSPL